MNQNDFNKLVKIRKLLKEAYDHYFESLDEALEAVVQWHRDEMNAYYNEFGEPRL
jgi:hypothetical protein